MAPRDLQLDVRDLGDPAGEPVVLLHGFPQDGHCWRLVWPALVAAGHRVLVPDQRGYSPGARPLEVEAYRTQLLVGDVLALLDRLGLTRAHVVGHDWGAAVGWQLAARHPDRVRSLVPVSVPHPVAFQQALRRDADQRRRSAYMRDFVAPGAEQAVDVRAFFNGGGPAVDVEHYLRRLAEPGALTAALNWYRAQDAALVGSTPAVEVPTTYVWSDQDAALGRTAAEATAGYVRGPYRFEVLPGVSHWVPEQAANQLAELLLRHLRS